jgi:hypothetical protein
VVFPCIINYKGGCPPVVLIRGGEIMSLAERMKGKIQKINEAPVYVKLLVYGAIGTGKTRLAATAPNVLFGNSESGTLSISGKDIDAYDIDSFLDLNDLAEFLQEHCILRDKLRRGIKVGASAKQLNAVKDQIWNLAHTQDEPRNGVEPTLYDSVVIDSLTDLQKKSLDEIMNDAKRLEKHDPDKANLEDYGKNTTQVRRVCRFFRDLPMNVTFVCLPADDKEDSGEPIVRPLLTPKLAEEVMGYVDVVGYLFVKKAKDENDKIILQRRLLVQQYDKFRAKIRVPEGVEPPMTIIDPTFQKIYDVVIGESRLSIERGNQ